MRRRMIYLAVTACIVGVAAIGWTLTSRYGYESAAYEVIEAEGNFEIRRYPDLMLAATKSDIDSQGNDGSFMRLFRYIGGANEDEQKIAMTTPVFMSDANSEAGFLPEQEAAEDGSMGFVLPAKVASNSAPEPTGAGVSLRKRKGGDFAVIRFAGQLNASSIETEAEKLKEWIESKGLHGTAGIEAAGYDPPFTPGPFRRNEVLIRLSDSSRLSTPEGSPDE